MGEGRWVQTTSGAAVEQDLGNLIFMRINGPANKNLKVEEFKAALAKGEGKDLPFDTVIAANIGNPQQLDQKPITFFRQVLSLLENPQLLEHEDVLVKSLGYKTDVVERAKWLLKQVGSVGAYSASNGVPAIKQSVADFLESAFCTVPSPKNCC